MTFLAMACKPDLPDGIERDNLAGPVDAHQMKALKRQ